MKRSEMVIKIANLLLDIAPSHYQGESSYGRQLDAGYILDLVEQEGMYPPDRLVEKHETSAWEEE
jgi:hypothetical protein